MARPGHLLVALALALSTAASGCSDGADDLGASICGDGMRGLAEVCDGEDLGGGTCRGYGFEGGALSCNSTCDGHLVEACNGLPGFRDRGEDPCQSCRADEVCSGLTCVARGRGAQTLPDALPWVQRAVTLVLDASGIVGQPRGAVIVEGLTRGRQLRLDAPTWSASVDLRLEDDLYRVRWRASDPETQLHVEPERVVDATQTALTLAPVLERATLEITGPPGRDLGGGAVRARPLDGPAGLEAEAWAQAEVSTGGVAMVSMRLVPGRHRIAYSGRAFSPRWGLTIPGPSELELGPAGPRGQRTVEVEARRVDVEVVLDGRPPPLDWLERFVVRSTDHPEQAAPLVLDEDGRAALWLPPGNFRLELPERVEGPDLGDGTSPVRWPVPARPMTLRGDLSSRVPEVEAIELVEVLERGAPAPWILERTSAGRFEGVAPLGPVQPFLRLADGRRWPLPERDGLAEGETLSLPTLATLRGRLTRGGAPVTGRAWVRLTPPGRPGWVSARAQVDEAGAFYVELPPGRYEVWTEGCRLHPGLELESGPTARAFDTKRVRLELVPADGSGAIALMPYLGRGPGAGPAFVEPPIVLTRDTHGPPPWALELWPGRYRATYLAEDHEPRALVLDAELAFDLTEPTRIELGQAPSEVEVRVPEAGAGATLSFEAPLWTRRVPIVGGVARGLVRGDFAEVYLLEEDGGRVRLFPLP